MYLPLHAAPLVLEAAASEVEGVNCHQLDWICVVENLRDCASCPASLGTFVAVMVTLSSVFLGSLTEPCP